MTLRIGFYRRAVPARADAARVRTVGGRPLASFVASGLALVALAVGAVAVAAPAAQAATFAGYETVVQGSDGQLRAFTPTGQIATGAFLAADSSPAIAGLGGGAIEIAFLGSGHDLWRASPETNWFHAGFEHGVTFYVAPGTSPAVASDGAGGWKIAFHGANGHLWTNTSGPADVFTDTGAAMAYGSSPALAWLPGAGGYEIAFAGADNLLWRAFPDTNFFHVGAGLGVAPGTSPAIATDGAGGWKIAFHAQGDHLWTVSAPNTATDTGAVMAAGSNPALAWLPGAGGYEIAFVGPDQTLWRAFPDTNWFHAGFEYGVTFGVAPGTSPSVASDGANGWSIAFHGSNGDLWSDTFTSAGADNFADSGTQLAAGTSPTITARTQ